MESDFLALYEHVVDIDLHIMIDLVLEDFIDQSLICSPDIFETKRHDFVAVQAFVSDKCRLLLILRCYLDLVVAEESIHEAE